MPNTQLIQAATTTGDNYHATRNTMSEVSHSPEALAAQISDLHIDSEAPSALKPRLPAQLNPGGAESNLQLEIRESGAPGDVLPACTEDRPVTYSLPWYTLPGLGDEQTGTINYLICTRCHGDYIKDSPLASQFVRLERPDESVTMCCFSSPRMKDILWPQALDCKSVEAIRSFMFERASINPCRGAEPTPPGYTVWFGLANSDIENFHVCHACFEDRIVDTAFQDSFGVCPDEEDVDQWTCNLGGIPYVGKTLSTMAKANDWPGFILGALKRLALQPCSGSEVQSDTTDWYLPADIALKGRRICETCFLEHIAHGPFREEFSLYTPSRDKSHTSQLWTCLLSNCDNLGIALALERAKQKLDFKIFSDAAKVISCVPSCTGEGNVGGNWWTLREGDYAFTLCESCHAGLSAFGLQHFFRQAKVDPEIAIHCTLYPSAPGGEGYLLKLLETLDRSVFSYFFNYVRENAGGDPKYKGKNGEEKQSTSTDVIEKVQVLPRCPEGRVVDYSLLWYRLVDMPTDEAVFLVCSRCYTDHIQDTTLAAQFEPVIWPNLVNAACSFWIPALKDFFWPDAVATDNTDTVRDYISRWVKAPPCVGSRGGSRVPGSIWYGMSNNEVEDFMICEACFLAHVVGTNFQSKFGQYPAEWQADIWACDLRFVYTVRALHEYSKCSDWDSFTVGAARRHGLRSCTGEEVYANSTAWYYPRRRSLSNLQVCASCYMDNWALTHFDEEFRQEHRGPPVGSSDFILFLAEYWKCHMGGNVPALMAAGEAKAQKDFDVFASAMSVLLDCLPCDKGGITSGEGWTLAGGCEAFVICHACYVGIIWCTGRFSEDFERTSWPEKDVKLCGLNSSAPRYPQFFSKFYESCDREDSSFFSGFVKQFAPLAPCPHNDIYTGRAWWGYPQARCCAECYEDWVSHTPLAKMMPLQGQVLKEDTICQMWSPRMRTLWLAVCEAGEPGSDELEAAVTEFCAIGQQREEVFWETVPAIKRLRAIKYAENANIRAQAMASVQYGGMSALSVVSGITDGHRYGNSAIGWHDTSSGAAAAQARASMMASMHGAASRDVELYQLQARWSKVE